MPDITVTGLTLTAVKALRVGPVQSIDLREHGAAGDRAFYLIDAGGEMINGKRLGELQSVVAAYDAAAGDLALTFPDGREVRAPVAHGEPLITSFFGQPRQARLLDGPWSAALSEFAGVGLRIVDGGSAVDRGREAGVSLMSQASLGRLAGAAERDAVDGRRFRMLVEIGGVGPHEEDGWVGRRVRLGPALIRVNGHVGRCMVTTRNPETGVVDLKTLHALAAYRRDQVTTEPLPFGVYGEVLEPGTVRLGDPVSLDG